MSIAKTRAALEEYGYTKPIQTSEILKIKDKNNWAKQLWQYENFIDEVENILQKQTPLDDYIEQEIELTPIEETLHNKEFWQKKTNIKDLLSALEILEFDTKIIDITNPLYDYLKLNNLAKPQKNTAQDKAEYLNSLNLSELKQLTKSLNKDTSQNKTQLIDTIFPLIPTDNLPPKLFLTSKTKNKIKEIVYAYIEQAAKAMSHIPLSTELKLEIIQDFAPTHALNDQKIREIINQHQPIFKEKNQAKTQNITMQTSEKTALYSLAFGVIVVGLVYFFVNNTYSWFVYLFIFIITSGWTYTKFLNIFANENQTNQK